MDEKVADIVVRFIQFSRQKLLSNDLDSMIVFKAKVTRKYKKLASRQILSVINIKGCPHGNKHYEANLIQKDILRYQEFD